MSKPLDPNGLSGAFAKGPPTSLDFLVPAKPKAKTKRKKKKKTTAKDAKKKKAAAKTTTQTTTRTVVVEQTAPSVARSVWTPAAPLPEPTSWRGRIAWRVERLVGKVLFLVLP